VWGSLQVDFLVVSRRSDGTLGVSIIDPHGDYLADTRPKLQALARYAELYGEQYVRIESIVKVGDQLRVLDLHDQGIRAEAMEFDGAQVPALYEGPPHGTTGSRPLSCPAGCIRQLGRRSSRFRAATPDIQVDDLAVFACQKGTPVGEIGDDELVRLCPGHFGLREAVQQIRDGGALEVGQ
jgi:hypothetical protein